VRSPGRVPWKQFLSELPLVLICREVGTGDSKSHLGTLLLCLCCHGNRRLPRLCLLRKKRSVVTSPGSPTRMRRGWRGAVVSHAAPGAGRSCRGRGCEVACLKISPVPLQQSPRLRYGVAVGSATPGRWGQDLPLCPLGGRICVTQTSDTTKHDAVPKVWPRGSNAHPGGSLAFAGGQRGTSVVGSGAVLWLPPRVTEQPLAGMWDREAKAPRSLRRDPRSSRGVGAQSGSGPRTCVSAVLQLRITESQNHRIVGVGRDLCGSSSPNPLPKQGHLQ